MPALLQENYLWSGACYFQRMLKDLLQGRFINHPLHPLFVHLPIGLWVGSVIFDIVFMAGHSPMLAAASFFCIMIGILGAIIALPTGLAEYFSISSNSVPKRLATTHMLLNIGIIAVYSINLLSRYKMLDGVPSVVTGGQFLLSLFSIMLLGVSGYLGGLLVFEYGIGFRPSDSPEFGESGERGKHLSSKFGKSADDFTKHKAA